MPSELLPFSGVEGAVDPAAALSAAEAHVNALREHCRTWQIDPAARWGGAPIPLPGELRHTDSSGTD
ncbi:MAG: hypothetical protein PHW10_00640 [Candidatus Peribacteraceae bacterium]|nr:hypothetical protein [Candidatus Peribacteraceae bacterium]